MILRDKAIVWLATGLGVGYLPLTPGTFGTLPGLLLCYWLARLSVLPQTAVIAALAAVAMWIAHGAEKALGEKDPHKIVIDEIAGMAVAMAGLPFGWLTAAAAFVAFRVFDVAKPFPVRTLERRLPGGVGVVMDDLAAGVYANLFVRLLLSGIQLFGHGS